VSWGPNQNKLKAGLANLVTDDWLFTHCVPHIRLRFPNDRRLCRILGLSTLYACCDPTLREHLPELQRTRLAAALQGIDYGVNAVEKIPLHVYSVNGNLFIDEMTQGGGQAGQAAGGAPFVPAAVGATTHGAVLQSILLNQQRTNQSQALVQVQMDNGFASMKQYIGRQFVTLNDQVRRFGGTIQGRFARQDPTQTANRQAAENEPPLPPNLPVGVECRDPTAELAPNLHTLEEIWMEWKFGIGGRKPAQLFSRRERGGHGSRSKKMKFCRRLKIYLLLQKLVDEGRTSAEAIAAAKLHYGAAKSVTQFSEAIRLIPNHPLLHPLPHRRQDPPLAPPNGGRGRGAGRGGRVQALPTQRRIAPIFRGPDAPRLMGTSVAVQGTLLAHINGIGTGNPTAIFQSNRVTANI